MFDVEYPIVAERDKKGKFVESPESLERKVISLRLPKSLYPKFVEIAKERNKEISVLAREIIEVWVREQQND